MRTARPWHALGAAGLLGISLWACGESGSPGGGSGSGGSGPMTGEGGSSDVMGSGGATPSGGTVSGGTTGAGGSSASGGAAGSSGGSQGSSGGAATGGATVPRGAGGRRTGQGGTGAGGAGTGGGTILDGGDPGTACTVGPWPEVDPATQGSFATVMEENVGPRAGAIPDGGAQPQFTLFRPKDLTESGLCHPVITWGNGTNCTPSIYKVLLNHLATHGFVVIASNSTNVAQGNPAPMVVGVNWVLEQNADPSSVMYQRIDTTHVGATGHSQGGFATTQAAGDSHITTIAPFCGASAQRNLHGPAMLLCGGNDTTVPCDGSIQSAFDGMSNQPIMLANYLSASHADWITYRGTTISPMETAVVAWMRVHLMGDTALRSRFYGATCALCQDPAWQITQKMMDQ